MVLVTTDRNGRWNLAGGTSIAAPYVTASIAALKSMFPNLSYQDVRARVLATADRSGQYRDSATYGQGRLDLDAASRPVGGTFFALGARDTDSVASTAGAYAALPDGAIQQYLDGRTILVVDGFQRAPFKTALAAFATPRSTYLSMDDLKFSPRRERQEGTNHAAVAMAGGGTFAHGVSVGPYFIGTGRGTDVVRSLERLGGTPLVTNSFRMSREAAGVVLGFDAGPGRVQAVAVAGGAGPGAPGFGVSGWNPDTVMAVSFTPGGAEVVDTGSFGLSFASGLGRPMGWDGSGALALEGNSFALAARRSVTYGDSVRVDLTGRLNHLALRDGPLLRFDDALVVAVEMDTSIALNPSVMFRARLGMERPVSGAKGKLHAATGVDERGRIAYRDMVIDGRDLLSFDRATLGFSVAAGPNAFIEFGGGAVRDGFGWTESLVGFKVEARF